MVELSDVLASLRPRASQTATTNWCDRFDQKHAPPLGIRRVATQLCHDLFGTKDVQDAITATYVWAADQLGHLTLGFVPTILGCWIVSLIWSAAGLSPGPLLRVIYILVGLAVVGVWAGKELVDLKDTSARTRKVFPPDSGDVIWNVKTALLYFATGALLGLSAFLWPPLVLIVLALALWPALSVAFWWLRRKLAFQQAALPYLYRLANFASELDSILVTTVSNIANLKDNQTLFSNVLLGRDPLPQGAPEIRHLLISGPLGAGKTCLCVGMGTEFAFGLGRARYLSATKLLELVLTSKPSSDLRIYDSGLILWNWEHCDLLIVDDVDAGVSPPQTQADAGAAHLIDPHAFGQALSQGGRSALKPFAQRRSVWVLGDATQVSPWRTAIAGLLGIEEREIALVELSGQLDAPAGARMRASGKLIR